MPRYGQDEVNAGEREENCATSLIHLAIQKDNIR